MPFNVRLAGRIEPKGLADAEEAERSAFYRRAGEVAVRILREQLLKGIVADGEKMIPRQEPRADGANGPVMDPHRRQSRTIRLMAFRAWGRGVTLFWHAAISRKQKLPWGNILQAHASGNVIGAYLRDTRMSPKSIAAVGDEMRTWWRARQRSKSRDRRRRPGDSTPPAVPQPLAARPSPYTYPKPYAGIYTRGARGRPRPRA